MCQNRNLFKYELYCTSLAIYRYFTIKQVQTSNNYERFYYRLIHIVLDCGDPKPTSGSVNSSQTTYASVVSVTCDKGFSLNGAAVIRCKADGTWSGDPTCTLIGKVHCKRCMDNKMLISE